MAHDKDGKHSWEKMLLRVFRVKENAEHELLYKRVISVPMRINNEPENVGVIEAAENVADEPGHISANAQRIIETLDGFTAGLFGKDIRSTTQMSQSSMYHALQQLMKNGYVAGNHNRYALTEAGRKLIHNR